MSVKKYDSNGLINWRTFEQFSAVQTVIKMNIPKHYNKIFYKRLRFKIG